MAVADGVVPSPPPPPPPASRNIAASLARSRLGRAAGGAVAAAVVCLFLACLWLLCAGVAVAVIARRACGEGSPVVAAAFTVVSVAAVTLGLACPVAVLLLLTRMAGSVTVAKEGNHDQEPTRKSIAAVAREQLCDTVTLAILVSVAFLVVMLVGELLKGFPPTKGSRHERIGSVISDVGAVGAEMLYCLIVLPISASRIWRSWRMP